MSHSITAIIPALNEEKNLEGAVNIFKKAALDNSMEYEIIIFNDASSDKTGEIANQLASSDKNIYVIHNEKRMGLGYNYFKGLELAKKEYVIMVPGDNEIEEDSIREIVFSAGKSDIIIPYTENMEIRPLPRRLTSRLFTALINLLFGLKIKYFNGPVLHKTELVKKVRISEMSFAYQAEILVKMIKSNRSYLEVPMRIKPREYGKSNAISLGNFIAVGKTILNLFRSVYFNKD
ncbi:MAG: glycosyltransferase family 2 protein [Elusimicrobiota bacterium]